ncbi:hypothetical protein NIES4072_24590 [Nostoc commune NIES-4072]|uniref:Uncharacterized protein n=1 Tax=Nostoc commune NIES-4072 TaxID=2005467 RepID=A0A2R5FSZ6_NOSCO|nr:hypothetical protein [Nostoc commune]BBD63885.1 hypothetical protein NIES4070_02270 [Nostoc commune HK-02]GBG18794.1 hypothetical protein NIES4072_24590 [Nostoc commune NIES-4072]
MWVKTAEMPTIYTFYQFYAPVFSEFVRNPGVLRCHLGLIVPKGLPKNKLFQEKQETGFIKNDNHFKRGEKGLPSATPFLPLIYA